MNANTVGLKTNVVKSDCRNTPSYITTCYIQVILRTKLTVSIPGLSTTSVAAIQVVQVVRRTRAHDPWGLTSEDQIAI